MAIRTEQTLRRMWDESALLFQQAGSLHVDAERCADAAAGHERAAAAETAAAASAHEAAKAKRSVAEGKEAEAADLADLVNRERQDAGLAPLTPGEPYPADPAPTGVVPAEQPMADDTLVASGQSATTTAVDGAGVTGEVAGNA